MRRKLFDSLSATQVLVRWTLADTGIRHLQFLTQDCWADCVWSSMLKSDYVILH